MAPPRNNRSYRRLLALLGILALAVTVAWWRHDHRTVPTVEEWLEPAAEFDLEELEAEALAVVAATKVENAIEARVRARKALAAGQRTEAAGYLEQAIALDAADHESRLSLARLLIERNEPDRATALSKAAVEIAPRDAEAWRGHIRC
jgi:tetratricopeptide (TPR) repeat protein